MDPITAGVLAAVVLAALGIVWALKARDKRNRQLGKAKVREDQNTRGEAAQEAEANAFNRARRRMDLRRLKRMRKRERDDDD